MSKKKKTHAHARKQSRPRRNRRIADRADLPDRVPNEVKCRSDAEVEVFLAEISNIQRALKTAQKKARRTGGEYAVFLHGLPQVISVHMFSGIPPTNRGRKRDKGQR